MVASRGRTPPMVVAGSPARPKENPDVMLTRCVRASAIGFCPLICVVAGLTVTPCPAEDWPQFRGPNRDGICAETDLLKEWPEGGPQMLWSKEGVGKGFSHPIIVDGTLYVTGSVDKKDEFITAFGLDGNQKWQTTYGKVSDKWPDDARCTPTFVDGSLYVISGAGEVVCLDAKSGESKWSVAARDQLKGEFGGWATAECPLVVDGKVIYTPGGKQTTVVALDAATGKTVWQSESLNDKSGYVAPVLIERGGKQQIVTVTANWVLGVSPADGKLLWKVDYKRVPPAKKATGINCTPPLYKDGQLYVTSGYDDVGIMIQLSEDGTQAEIAWSDPTLDNHHGGVVTVDGHIYGANWEGNPTGSWVCLDWKTGKPAWTQKWNGKGSLIYADGMLYCYDEKKGEVGLVKASPTEFALVSSFPIGMGAGQHWAHPVISDGRLYMRHGDALMAYDIKGK